MGTIYQRGRFYWLQWCHQGRRVYRERAQTEDREAKRRRSSRPPWPARKPQSAREADSGHASACAVSRRGA